MNSSSVNSNGPRFAARPLTEPGTSITEWLAGERPPPVNLDECPALVVVAAHPDDETLGVGAMIAALVARGVEVVVVSVSDGGAAHPGVTQFDQMRLETTRCAELDCAAAVLGVHRVVRLGMPDGRIADFEEQLVERLTGVLSPGVWCAVTWRGDGHPDHEAAGRAAAVAAERTGAQLLEYPIWMWHWADPADAVVPWQRAVSVPVDRDAADRKQRAVRCFRSQIEAATPDVAPVLAPFVVRRLLAVGEVLFR